MGQIPRVHFLGYSLIPSQRFRQRRLLRELASAWIPPPFDDHTADHRLFPSRRVFLYAENGQANQRDGYFCGKIHTHPSSVVSVYSHCRHLFYYHVIIGGRPLSRLAKKEVDIRIRIYKGV